MKRKVALQGIALLLTLSTTTSVFASDIKVEIVGGGDINIYNTKKEEATELPTIQEEIEKDKPIPYTEEEYQYLMINFTEPYTEERYKQLIGNKESFVISDSRLIQKNIKSSIYLNKNTFIDDAFRKELYIILNINENDVIPPSKLNIIEMNINSQNQSIMYLDGIEHFKSLQKIVMPNQNIQSSSISNLRFLPLKYLDLKGNNIISVEDFKYLTQLEYLDLYDNALGTYYNWITNLKYCKKLKYLNLGGSQRLEDTGVRS